VSVVRPAAVAGMFYPGDAGELRSQVEDLLAAAAELSEIPGVAPKAVIAPHAGYIYSGLTAAVALRALTAPNGRPRRLVILGPAHRVPIAGLALPAAASFSTPLGEVPVDLDLAARVAELPGVEVDATAHAEEHSLEVELPFLQVLLDEDLQIVPLVVGNASPATVSAVLESVWDEPGTRIVISSDLSHYHPYDVARRLDQETAERILALHGPIAYDRACGAGPINGLLEVARRRSLSACLLDLRNSGDTAGDRRQVVGYGAFSFAEAA